MCKEGKGHGCDDMWAIFCIHSLCLSQSHNVLTIDSADQAEWMWSSIRDQIDLKECLGCDLLNRCRDYSFWNRYISFRGDAIYFLWQVFLDIWIFFVPNIHLTIAYVFLRLMHKNTFFCVLVFILLVVHLYLLVVQVFPFECVLGSHITCYVKICYLSP